MAFFFSPLWSIKVPTEVWRRTKYSYKGKKPLGRWPEMHLTLQHLILGCLWHFFLPINMLMVQPSNFYGSFRSAYISSLNHYGRCWTLWDRASEMLMSRWTMDLFRQRTGRWPLFFLSFFLFFYMHSIWPKMENLPVGLAWHTQHIGQL